MATRLVWDKTGEHFYNTGIDQVALYVYDSALKKYGKPVAWNGVTALSENPTGAESNKLYADNIEYLNLISKEEFGLSITCYQTPEEFDECDGTALLGGLKFHGTGRKTFGLAYRTLVGNDIEEAGAGQNYILHVVYGCKAAPSTRDNNTVNDSPEAIELSYEITTTPVTDFGDLGATLKAAGVKSVAHLEIDCSKLTSTVLANLEARLFDADQDMPTVAEIYTIVGGAGKLATPTDAEFDEGALTWEAVTNADRYNVIAAPVVGGVTGDYRDICTVISTSVTLSNFLAAGSYKVKVCARGAGYADSDYTEEVSATVAAG